MLKNKLNLAGHSLGHCPNNPDIDWHHPQTLWHELQAEDWDHWSHRWVRCCNRSVTGHPPAWDSWQAQPDGLQAAGAVLWVSEERPECRISSWQGQLVQVQAGVKIQSQVGWEEKGLSGTRGQHMWDRASAATTHHSPSKTPEEPDRSKNKAAKQKACHISWQHCNSDWTNQSWKIISQQLLLRPFSVPCSPSLQCQEGRGATATWKNNVPTSADWRAGYRPVKRHAAKFVKSWIAWPLEKQSAVTFVCHNAKSTMQLRWKILLRAKYLTTAFVSLKNMLDVKPPNPCWDQQGASAGWKNNVKLMAGIRRAGLANGLVKYDLSALVGLFEDNHFLKSYLKECAFEF